MDPISIGTAAAGLVRICVKLSGQLFTFVGRVRTVDESIKTLQFEIDSLSSALSSIKLSFDDPLLAEAIVNTQARHERRHWQNVRQSLDHCLNTLTKLERILDDVETCEGQFLVSTRRRVRMDMRSADMVLLKEQIASCRRTLQLSLQLITVSSLLNHGVANAAISSRLDNLMEEMQTFRIEFRDHWQALANEQRFNQTELQVMNNLDDCLRSAEVVASNAATIISTRSTLLNQSPSSASRRHVRDRTAVWVENHVHDPAVAETENDLRSSVTSETMAQPVTPSPSTGASTITARVQSVVTPSMTTSGVRRTENVFSLPNETQLFENVDFFDDVQPELIRAWLKEGKTLFDRGNYDDASEYMRTVVTHARTIEYDGKAENIEESLNLLAKCYCHLDDWDTALTTLRELLNDNTRTALQIAETHHALADTYLIKEDYDSAETSCRDAIQKKWRILPRNDESVHSSIVLLVQILEAKGFEHVAVGYKALLPAETRISKRITIREKFKAQLKELTSMDRNEAADKLGHKYFQGLIPRKPCVASRERQWQEIRTNFLKGGLAGAGKGYSLLHACAEYGHELLLPLVLESSDGRGINWYDAASNVPLARAVIGHENGIKVPASVSRILLKSNADVGWGAYVDSEGLYASQKTRVPRRSILDFAKDGSWPWPETRGLVIETGRRQGYS